ncbi:hypothetical protein C7M84_017985 [Penaeus vannamei]|uniref:PKD domain-containing protein n=1 Tax=Penaeus vannamei TaxID=6689 RepID=A0A423SIX2_PENVA|nr:hypothetical protein C7M84_017985 [Penaeus vannamei]
MSNVTSCERNITDLGLSAAQFSTDNFDSTLNEESPYYVSSRHELSHTVQLTAADTYTVTASASNKHNEETGPVESTVTVVAQDPVLMTWAMAPSEIAFLAPVDLPTVSFTEGTGAPFPTDASVTVDWGDGSSPTSHPFTDPPSANHIYAAGGTYSVNATIYNFVSSFNVICEVEIVEQIVDFSIAVKYLPHALATTLNEGTGKDENEYPIKRNLTFYPSMAMGTVDRYTLEHNGTVVAAFEVEDPLNPTLTTFDYYYDEEVEITVTVRAINFFESVPFDFVMLIVGEVKSVRLDDYSVTTGKNETKTLLVTFESIGGSTCLIINWGDLSLTSYGDFYTCTTENMEIPYEPGIPLDISMNVTHVYWEEGPYTVTAMAFNSRSNTLDELPVIVTSIDCAPPRAQVIDGAERHYNAPSFHRGFLASVSTAATLNCAVTSKTKNSNVDVEVPVKWARFAADGTASLRRGPKVNGNKGGFGRPAPSLLHSPTPLILYSFTLNSLFTTSPLTRPSTFPHTTPNPFPLPPTHPPPPSPLPPHSRHTPSNLPQPTPPPPSPYSPALSTFPHPPSPHHPLHPSKRKKKKKKDRPRLLGFHWLLGEDFVSSSRNPTRMSVTPRQGHEREAEVMTPGKVLGDRPSHRQYFGRRGGHATTLTAHGGRSQLHRDMSKPPAVPLGRRR